MSARRIKLKKKGPFLNQNGGTDGGIKLFDPGLFNWNKKMGSIRYPFIAKDDL